MSFGEGVLGYKILTFTFMDMRYYSLYLQGYEMFAILPAMF